MDKTLAARPDTRRPSALDPIAAALLDEEHDSAELDKMDFMELVRLGASQAEIDRHERRVANLEMLLAHAKAGGTDDISSRLKRPEYWERFVCADDEVDDEVDDDFACGAYGELAFGPPSELLASELAQERARLAAARQRKKTISREIRDLRRFRARARVCGLRGSNRDRTSRPSRHGPSSCRSPRRRRTTGVVRTTGDPDPDPEPSGDARARLRSVALNKAARAGGGP